MPKVLRPGNTAPQGPPPAGMQATCPQCGARLETTANEPTARGGVLEDGPMTVPGWYIDCPEPECGYNVFFRRP